MCGDETILAVGVMEAARKLGLSPRTIATVIARRELPSRRLGRRRLIPQTALLRFVQSDHSTPSAPRKKVGR
jgi:excisionase family DNA binding protein